LPGYAEEGTHRRVEVFVVLQGSRFPAERLPYEENAPSVEEAAEARFHSWMLPLALLGAGRHGGSSSSSDGGGSGDSSASSSSGPGSSRGSGHGSQGEGEGEGEGEVLVEITGSPSDGAALRGSLGAALSDVEAEEG